MMNINRINILQTVSAAALVSAASALAQSPPPSLPASPLQPNDFLVSGASPPVAKDVLQAEVDAVPMPEPVWDGDKPFDPEARPVQFPAPAFAPEMLEAFRPAARAALGLHQGDVQELRSVQTPVELALSLHIDDQDRIIRLHPHSLRDSEAQLLVQIEGGLLIPHEWPAPATYRGFVEGMPDVDVAASVLDGKVSMLILPRDPTKPTWHVQPLSDALPGVPAGLHAVYRNVDVIPTNAMCGTPDHDAIVIHPRPADPDRPPLALRLHQQVQPHAPAHDPTVKPDGDTADGDDEDDDGGIAGEDGGGDDGSIAVANVRCQIALDADFEYYQANGSSVLNTIYEMERMMNHVGLIYQNQVGIAYTETFIIIRSNVDDPYTTGLTGSGMRDQFRDHWIGNHAGVTRDVAHLFSNRTATDSFIGFAYFAGICNANNGANSGYCWSSTFWSTALANKVGTVAHELGHVWNATHCDGAAGCGIMNSSINGSWTFGTPSANLITTFRDTLACLDLWQNPTHVNWAYNGIETGSATQPWNTIFEGLDACLVGGELHVQGGNYFQNPNIFQARNIRAFNGTVRIGSN